VLSPLNTLLKEISSRNAALCAKTCDVFSLLPWSKHLQLILPIVDKALTADAYSILRCARHAAYACYVGAYYGTADESEQSKKLAERLAAATKVGDGSARLHWAYLACVRFADVAAERAFVDALWAVSKRSWNPHLVGVLSRHEELEGTMLSSAAIAVARECGALGSWFALAVANDLVNPEGWNILGTTVVQFGKDWNALDAYEKAAYLYSLAWCFDVGRHGWNPKYGFNYVHARSKVLELRAEMPERDFIRDVLVPRPLEKVILNVFHWKCFSRILGYAELPAARLAAHSG
jgi:hypothetical protein